MRARLVPLWGVVASFGCSTPQSASVTQAVESQDLVTIERAAIDAWIDHREGSLAELEAAFAQALRTEYTAPIDTAAGHARIVSAAIIQWAHDVRVHLHTPLHTAVPALADDPDCKGSVIGDAVLLDYADAVLGGTDRVQGVVEATRKLARNMTCLGPLQTEQLATQMVLAFDDVRATLLVNGLDEAIPYVAQAVSQPMLLVHDVERQHGPEAPLARWFAAYEQILVEGALSKHHPAAWHGLWLYDRITGRLRGFRVAKDPRDENDLDLAALFHTVAQPQPQDLRCSLAEMVQRGTRDGRYVCDGDQCRDSSDPVCAAVNAGDSAPEHGGEVSIAGLSTSTQLDCISAQAAATPSRKQLNCVIEATGLRADRRELVSKQLETVPLAGIKNGGACGISDAQADRDYNRRIAYAENTYNAAVEQARQQLSQAIENLKAEQANRDDVFASTTDPAARATAQAAVDQKEEAVNKLSNQLPGKLDAAAKQRAADIKAAEDARAAANANSNGSGASGSGGGGSAGGGSAGDGSDGDGGSDAGAGSGSAGMGYCELGAESCGNGCSAMQSQAQRALDCFDDDPKEPDPLMGPGGCGGDCDPVEPGKPTSGAQCLGELDMNIGSRLSQACWVARCGPSDHSATEDCCGKGGLTASGEPEMQGMCGNVDCEDGVPSFIGGHCQCGGSLPPSAPGGVVVPTPNGVPLY